VFISVGVLTIQHLPAVVLQSVDVVAVEGMANKTALSKKKN
jgi:hypothetical protein